MPSKAVCEGDGKEIDLDEAVLIERYDLVSKGPFKCTLCYGKMFVRGGGKRTKLHFAHYHDCEPLSSSRGGGGESEEHRRCKDLIAENKDLISIHTCICQRKYYDLKGMVAEKEGRVGQDKYKYDVLMKDSEDPQKGWIAVEVFKTHGVGEFKLKHVDEIEKNRYGLPRILQLDCMETIHEIEDALTKKRRMIHLYESYCSRICERCAGDDDYSESSDQHNDGGSSCNKKRKRKFNHSGSGWGAILREKDHTEETLRIADARRKEVLDYTTLNSVLKVEAVAGAGKSTLLKDYARKHCLDEDHKGLILCFNKDPKKELEEELKESGVSVKVDTLDHFFWHCWEKDDRNGKDGREMMGGKWSHEDLPGISEMCMNPKKHKKKAGKHSGCTICVPILEKSMEDFILSSNSEPCTRHCREHVQKTWTKNFEEFTPEALMFVRQIWNNVIEKCKKKQKIDLTSNLVKKLIQVGKGTETVGKSLDDLLGGYRFILVDECQDLSACEASLVLKARENATCIAVGDELQNINGFRGSSEEAFKDLDCSKTINLPCTWRFSYPLNAFVEYVCGNAGEQKYDLNLTSAREGGTKILQVSSITQCLSIEGVENVRGLSCIFRTNVGILNSLFELFGSKGPSAVHGEGPNAGLTVSAPSLVKKFGGNLQDFIDLYKFHVTGANPGISLVPSYCETFQDYKSHCYSCNKEDMGLACKFVENQAAKMNNNTMKFSAIIGRIKKAMVIDPKTENETVINFYTAHGAKGKTLDKVYVAEDFNLSSEENTRCLYVALTRAQTTCFLHDAIYELIEERSGQHIF